MNIISVKLYGENFDVEIPFHSMDSYNTFLSKISQYTKRDDYEEMVIETACWNKNGIGFEDLSEKLFNFLKAIEIKYQDFALMFFEWIELGLFKDYADLKTRYYGEFLNTKSFLESHKDENFMVLKGGHYFKVS